MSPERFHDALNYLDDDLIRQTNDLRQGRRVLHRTPTARQVIQWAVPAACLVVVLSAAPRLLPALETGDSTVMEQEAASPNNSPAEALQDYACTSGNSTRQDSVSCAWIPHTCEGLSLRIPENWECLVEETGDARLMAISPPNEAGAVLVGYRPNFGVCGTGLTTEEKTIAGMTACVGTYDNNHVWSFITFSGVGEGYVVLNDGADAWWGAYGDTVMEILETIVIEEKE